MPVKKLLLLTILCSTSALACPKGAPRGYEKIEGQKERAYRSKDSASVVVVKCGLPTNAEELKRGLAQIGEVHEVNEKLAYVQMWSGPMRIYATITENPTQVSVVAKSPEALDKAGRDVVAYLSAKK